MNSKQIITCPACGAKNRVSTSQVDRGLAPVCGRCKAALPVSSEPIEATDANFTKLVEESPLPVLVDAWAPWCGPCKLIAPTIDQLASELTGQVRVVKLNVDENPRTAARLNISGIPALLVFKDGQEVDRLVGIHPKPEIAQRLQRVIA
jgi:thioredoxin 2